MNSTAKARAGYGAAAAPARTPRASEYDLIARVTAQLKSAEAKGRDGFAELVQAVHINQRLWTTLAIDVASDTNALPDPLRARIVYLADFTRQHSRKVLGREAGIDPLVEINTSVLRGLRGDTGAEA